jgi:DNA-directed RNA polymerase specialized sigma24 family protein
VSSTGSVTWWLGELKRGNLAATQPLWERYFRRLVERAYRSLAGIPRRAADEEDVALSAFNGFCQAVAQGRFPRLEDRQDLWQVLLVITDRKARDLAKYEGRAKRGGKKVLDEAALTDPTAGASPLAQIVAQEPGPELATQVAEEFQRLLRLLKDAELEQVAMLKMEGYALKEIAERQKCTTRTVQRRLQLIRRIWEEEGIGRE